MGENEPESRLHELEAELEHNKLAVSVAEAVLRASPEQLREIADILFTVKAAREVHGLQDFVPQRSTEQSGSTVSAETDAEASETTAALPEPRVPSAIAIPVVSAPDGIDTADAIEMIGDYCDGCGAAPGTPCHGWTNDPFLGWLVIPGKGKPCPTPRHLDKDGQSR